MGEVVTERRGATPTSWACGQSDDPATVAAAADTYQDSSTVAFLSCNTTHCISTEHLYVTLLCERDRRANHW